MKKLSLLALALGSSLATASSLQNMTLSSGISYDIYRSLNVAESNVSGGTAKVLQGATVSMACYKLPRYVCSVALPSEGVQFGADGSKLLKITDSTFVKKMFAALNVTEEQGTKKIVRDKYSAECHKEHGCSIVVSPKVEAPIEPIQPRVTCQNRIASCTFAGYCYSYNGDGGYDYGYSYSCPGTSTDRVCSDGTVTLGECR